jgi:hypothetical protein
MPEKPKDESTEPGIGGETSNHPARNEKSEETDDKSVSSSQSFSARDVAATDKADPGNTPHTDRKGIPKTTKKFCSIVRKAFTNKGSFCASHAKDAVVQAKHRAGSAIEAVKKVGLIGTAQAAGN